MRALANYSTSSLNKIESRTVPTISADFDALLRDAFQRSVQLALREALANAEWKIERTPDSKNINKSEAFVLTVAGVLFRLVLVLHFNFDPALKQFVQDAVGQQQDKLDDDKVYDFVAEISNCFCGGLKRELQAAVPSLGMSTPNRLAHASLKYLSMLKLAREGHVLARLGDVPMFGCSFYLSAYGDLNYTKQIASQQSTTEVGELEMF